MKKNRISVVVFVVIFSFILFGCGTAALPKGEVKGILVDSSGTTGSGLQVMLGPFDNTSQDCTMTNESIKKSVFADKKGTFDFTDMPAGKYCLVIFDGKSGITGVILTADKKSLIINLSDTAGVDMGKVNMSNLQLP